MHVRQFESAQLLCLNSLYPPLSMRKECIQDLFVELRLVTRSDSDRDLVCFFLYMLKKKRAAATVKFLSPRPSLEHTYSAIGLLREMLIATECTANVSKLHILTFPAPFTSSKLCSCSFEFHFMHFKLLRLDVLLKRFLCITIF